MSKRQRIDAEKDKNDASQRTFVTITHGGGGCDSNTPLDILPTHNFGSNSTISASSSNSGSPTSSSHLLLAKTTSSSGCRSHVSEMSSTATSDELDHAVNILYQHANSLNENGTHGSVEFPDLLKTSPILSTPTKHNDSVPTINSNSVSSPTAMDNVNGNGPIHVQPPVPSGSSSSNSATRNTNTTTNETSHRLSASNSSFSSLNNVDEFQLYLMKQCLCNIDDSALRRPFATHWYKDRNGVKHTVPLIRWPKDKLIQFLSNIELLFEVYLNQNAKGEICTRVMQVCDAVLLNEQNIVDDIFQLGEHNDRFVQYLAIKVLANCMLIAKDKEEYCENLITTMMSELIVSRSRDNNREAIDPTDPIVLRKVSFILGIILHIMEWKDIRKHPLDDQIVINGRELCNDSDNETFTLPVELPPIENNYFAIQFSENNQSALASPSSSSSSPTAQLNNHRNNEHINNQPNSTRTAADAQSSCQLQYLSDSESFDSKELKYRIACSLRIKWPYLVDNMATCIAKLQENMQRDPRQREDLSYIRTAITTFLTLWERIINVDTCISFDEQTMPFHEKLATFQKFLERGHLPVFIYKQILTLFSASLCYTTTLALQSEVPFETNNLANKIFKGVQDQKIFTSLPTHKTEPKASIGFVGYNHGTVVYPLQSDRLAGNESGDEDEENENDNDFEGVLYQVQAQKSLDFILLQKLVLLILKAIVVTVRPIRSGDSSDSSMDSCSSSSSSSNNTDNVTLMMERATSDVFKKLKLFLRNKLNHHPDAHLGKVIVHLFSNQDDYLIEAMLCMLGTTIAFLPRQSPFGRVANQDAAERNRFRELIDMISPVYTFLEFLELIHHDKQTMLDFLLTDDTCFLLYFLRFLKYIRSEWTVFWNRCYAYPSPTMPTTLIRPDGQNKPPNQTLDRAMDVLTRLRMKLERLVQNKLFPYDISPLLVIMAQCESLSEGNDHGLF